VEKHFDDENLTNPDDLNRWPTKRSQLAIIPMSAEGSRHPTHAGKDL
jgi:hypothetical protein